MASIRCLRIALAILLYLFAAQAWAQRPCLIFVHGMAQGHQDLELSYNDARAYWTNSSSGSDFIYTATNYGRDASYFVVQYNGGTVPWWDDDAAGTVSRQIKSATDGNPDHGGHRCAKSAAQGGSFWVVDHSMGGAVMDYILGNSDPSDPNYQATFGTVGERIGLVFSLAGVHRGSQMADLDCAIDESATIVGLVAAFWEEPCDIKVQWLQTSMEVGQYMDTPPVATYLTGGWHNDNHTGWLMIGSSDGAVEYGSVYDCGGNSPLQNYTTGNVCDNSHKRFANYFNLDAAYQTHSSMKDDSYYGIRQQTPDGIWRCGGSPCATNSTVQNAMSTAQLIHLLVTTWSSP